MKPTICLSMIVKNEAVALSKSLKLLKPYIDYWIISDTGSSDNTSEIIQEILGDLPGELHSNPWVDFSTNRNIALKLAKNKADYVLICDADDAFIVQNLTSINNISANAYKIKIKHSENHPGLEYFRTQLIKSSVDCEYVGVLHEYLDIKEKINQEILDGVHFIYNAFSGSRGSNSQKYLSDAKVLEEAISKDPNNARYVFYLAQTYYCAGNLEKAIEFYTKRASMGGWQEEVYCSWLNIGKISETLSKPTVEIEIAYLKAYYSCPHRSESLYYLSKYFRIQGNYNKGYCYAKEALKISEPKESLFLEKDCYEYKSLDELSICAYYVGAMKEGREACENLLSMNLPENEKNRVINNYKFYL